VNLEGHIEQLDGPLDDAPRAEEIRSALEKALASRTFRSAETQRRFLRFAVEETLAGRKNRIKEYVIGMEALGRGEAFDPRLDPIVRTEARKLRARLTKYYDTEGGEDCLRIEFPKGSYAPTFRAVEMAVPVQSEVASLDIAASPILEQPRSVVLQPPLNRRRAAMVAAIVLVGAGLGGFGLAPLLVKDVGNPGIPWRGTRSIAVAPFENGGDRAEDEFLCEGLTEGLVDALAQVPGLQLMGRTSTLRFNEKPLGIRGVGQKPYARIMLGGKVHKAGNRLNVTARLENTADGHYLWSGNYDRDLRDAPMIAIEIVRTVADVLGVQLARNPERTMANLGANLMSPNPEAYQNYQRGRYFFNQMTAESLKTAIRYFQNAIVADASFARAFAALADSYVMSPQLAAVAPLEAIPQIRAAANRALELDHSLGEPHFDLAVCAEYEFDWSTAKKEFERGLELSPRNPVGHLWYAKYLALTGRKAEVLEHRRIAAELDPVSPYALQSVAGYFSVMGRHDEAIELFRNALAIEPRFGLSHQGLGVAYLLKGMTGEAIAELKTANELMQGSRRLALLGYAYAVSGKTEEAQRILDDFLAQVRSGPFPALPIAQVYIGLGEKDRAFEWLQRAIDQRDLDLTLQWDSPYETLRADPRYRNLLRRMKLV
jgi:TolB-like protein/Tfp pilus assembly protein PilF